MWNAKCSKFQPDLEWQWPVEDYWQPLLKRIAVDYLPYLHQNALAIRDGVKRFDYKGQNFVFPNTATTNYRAWCRKELQREFAQLSPEDQARIETLFASAGGLGSLHADGVIHSGMGAELQLPRDPSTVKRKPGFFARYYGQPRN